ncbi:MAG: LamG domain-containing protein, partial [Chloroflexi bacterium]|nr:LamG domain-containing protein [Chloroflexota bacterium]
MGCWIYPDDFSALMSLIDKFLPSGQGDYRLQLSATTGVIQFLVNDPSTGRNPHLDSDSGLTAGQWSHVVVTYDGTGGNNALADPNCVIYVDGAKVAATYTDDGGGYVAMEGGTNDLDIANANGTAFFNGKMAGGPLGPFFLKSELSGDAVLRLYEVGRRALNL